MKQTIVMIAEDEALVALDLAWALEDAGIHVIGPCMSLEECMDYLVRGEQVDVALLDVDLGGRDVFPAAKELERRGVPILFHTGHGDRSQITSEFAGSRLCRKPCDVRKIVHEIQALAA